MCSFILSHWGEGGGNNNYVYNIDNKRLIFNLFKNDDIVYTIDRWRKLLLILHCYSIIVSNLDFYLFFSAHPCTVISYCNVMFNGIKHIIPHIASILELISSENQCTFSYERLQTWSNATIWLHEHNIQYQYIIV